MAFDKDNSPTPQKNEFIQSNISHSRTRADGHQRMLTDGGYKT